MRKAYALIVAGLVSSSGLCSGSSGPAEGLPVSGVVAIVGSFAPVHDPFQGQFCAGVVIGSDEVLTAAHCVAAHAPSDLEVLVGGNDLCAGAQIAGRRISVEAIVISSGYDPEAGEADTAVLRLTRAAGEPARTLEIAISPGRATAYGWAPNGSEASACELHAIELDIPAQDQCPKLLENSTRNFSAETMICAVSVGSSRVCRGDSGGPLVAGDDSNQKGAVIGLVSWGLACTGPAAYARVPANFER